MLPKVLWRLVAAVIGGVALLALIVPDAGGPLLAWPTRLTANMTAGAMHLLGISAMQHGTVIFHADGFAYEIYYRCIGVLPATVLITGMLAWPAVLREKLIGLSIGIPVVLGVNLIRLLHLFVIGVNHPEYFWIAHRVLWEAAMLGSTVAIWAYWLRWIAWRREGPVALTAPTVGDAPRVIEIST